VGYDTDFQRTAWTWDEAGNMTSEEYGYGRRDAVTMRTTWTWDENGNKLTEEIDHLDGAWEDERTVWTALSTSSSPGRLVSHSCPTSDTE